MTDNADPRVWPEWDVIAEQIKQRPSLRDYFAGQALAGLVTRDEWRLPVTAHDAYAVADAMLAARKEARMPDDPTETPEAAARRLLPCIYDGHDCAHAKRTDPMRLCGHCEMRPAIAAEMRKREDALRLLILDELKAADVLAAERDRLRAALAELSRLAWTGGGDINGGDFESVMLEHGVWVSVPATKELREEYECETMHALAWKEARDG